MNRALIALLALSCAAACNQAEPVDSSAPKDAGAGGGGATEGADYFPLRDGASWKYLHSNGMWTETVTVEALSEADRFLLTTSADPDGMSEKQTLVEKDGEVLRVGQEAFVDGVLDQTVEYDPGFLRFSAAWAEQKAGFSERRTYDRTETKAGGSAKAPVARAHIYTIESFSDEVDVPAGVFRSCMRVRRERDYDTSAPDGGTLAEEQEKRYWFCPGVGKVREQSIMTMSYEVLTKYDLPEP